MRWNVRALLPVASDFSSDNDGDSAIHPVTRALLEARGLSSSEEIDRFFYPEYGRDMHDPFLFTSMERVVARVRAEREEGNRKVGVFGDYDADGVTSSALLRTALEQLGFQVSVYIPDKNTEGHGLHVNAIDHFERDGVRLAFTVDCGMTNHAEIAEAGRRGMDFIIIDHHHVPPVLPEAYAIVNPKLTDIPDDSRERAGGGYPFTELCGAGTTFKVIQALYTRLAPGEADQSKWLLDLAAIGTVADCMPLIGENRVIVKYGLIVLGKTRRMGIQELRAVGRIGTPEDWHPDAWSISFQIAPRINAASRMAHAREAHDLLMANDRVRARDLALELESHNTERQKVSAYVTEQVRKVAVEQSRDRKLIFAVHEEYPFGIVGLVAGRIANEFARPAVVLERREEISQGSLRSIPAVNIIEAVEECADLLVKFGGHAQAAGLTVRNENLDAFYDRLNSIIEKKLEGVVVDPELAIDLELSPYHLTPTLLAEIRRFAPFGQGNPEPVFLVRRMMVADARLVGNGSKHLKLVVTPENDSGSGKRFDCIAFGLGERFPDLAKGTLVDIVFQLDENTWNGTTKLQLKVVDMRAA